MSTLRNVYSKKCLLYKTIHHPKHLKCRISSTIFSGYYKIVEFFFNYFIIKCNLGALLLNCDQYTFTNVLETTFSDTFWINYKKIDIDV